MWIADRAVQYIIAGAPRCWPSPIAMSDLLYPEIVAGNEFNVAILTFIPQLRYTIATQDKTHMATLYQAMPPSAPPTFKCKFPAHYFHHLERFLWRYYLFSALYEHSHLERKELTRTGAGFVERLLILLDTVLEQLVMSCANLDVDMHPGTRIAFFDDYLVTEYIVGRHDPASVDAWRRNPDNVDLDLESIGPDELGAFVFNTPVFDLTNQIFRLESI